MTSTIRFREYDDSSSSLLCKSNNSKNDGTNARFRECIIALDSPLPKIEATSSSSFNNLLNWKIVCINEFDIVTKNSNNGGKQKIHELYYLKHKQQQYDHYYLIHHLQKIKDRWTHQLTQIVKDLFLPVGYV